ncbi:hypothetical protein AVEN_106115-1 [Araneus ventricosus]|uniref:Uncharacterized protein n=1 Tax=Araneus ventricosus TaxID=182803 RepID=A0A4Y2U550_ARAVE|nr:hypothetical protein AVEN_106115-1 [Araneus ventricosus]
MPHPTKLATTSENPIKSSIRRSDPRSRCELVAGRFSRLSGSQRNREDRVNYVADHAGPGSCPHQRTCSCSTLLLSLLNATDSAACCTWSG